MCTSASSLRTCGVVDAESNALDQDEVSIDLDELRAAHEGHSCSSLPGEVAKGWSSASLRLMPKGADACESIRPFIPAGVCALSGERLLR